jgi:hypothetical protein
MKSAKEILEKRFEMATQNYDIADFLPNMPVFKESLKYVEDTTDIELSELMKHWMLENPAVFETFLVECAQNKELSRLVVAGLVRAFDFWNDQEIFGNYPEISDFIDSIFTKSFDCLVPPIKDWVAERPGVQAALNLKPGIDFIPFGIGPEVETKLDQWPDDIPSIDTVEGVQKRLFLYSYLEEITGQWDEKTTRAIFRLQLDHGHPKPNGQLDDITMEMMTEGEE